MSITLATNCLDKTTCGFFVLANNSIAKTSNKKDFGIISRRKLTPKSINFSLLVIHFSLINKP